MNFQHPLILLLLLPLSLLFWAHARRSLSSVERKRFPLVLLAMACCVLGLANPYWRYTAEKEVIRGIDYVVILDVSQSMFCVEGGRRRVDRAIEMINGILPRLWGSSGGVIYFAKDARVGCPLTPDLSALPLFFETVEPGMNLRMGTESGSIPDALREILSAREAQRNTVGLLFSDGELADRGSALASWVKDRRDFTLFTILCGNTRAQVPELDLQLPHPGAFSQPDARVMAQLASAGGGAAFELTHTPINKIEKALLAHVRETVAAGRQVPDYNPFPLLALAAVLLVVYRLYPYITGFGSRAAIPVSLLILCLVSVAMNNQRLDPQALFTSALRDTKAKKYDEAARKLQELNSGFPSEEVDIALGNVEFARRRYDESIVHYKQALEKNPTNARARWNWEVALKQRSNQSPPTPPPQTTPPPPEQIPKDVSALLNYFDQQEKEQIKQNNRPSEQNGDFEW